MNDKGKYWPLKSSVVALTAISLTSCGTTDGNEQVTKKMDKPNVIFILADDLGYADLSCLGQSKFSTPNIDRLASQGMMFTQHYSGSSVSAPSRSCLITGQQIGRAHV